MVVWKSTFLLERYGGPRYIHSFPTRRSSDLVPPNPLHDGRRRRADRNPRALVPHDRRRSEEHTSELQSRGHLVCRLLLEKKKKLIKTHHRGHYSKTASIGILLLLRGVWYRVA